MKKLALIIVLAIFFFSCENTTQKNGSQEEQFIDSTFIENVEKKADEVKKKAEELNEDLDELIKDL